MLWREREAEKEKESILVPISQTNIAEIAFQQHIEEQGLDVTCPLAM